MRAGRRTRPGVAGVAAAVLSLDEPRRLHRERARPRGDVPGGPVQKRADRRVRVVHEQCEGARPGRRRCPAQRRRHIPPVAGVDLRDLAVGSERRARGVKDAVGAAKADPATASATTTPASPRLILVQGSGGLRLATMRRGSMFCDDSCMRPTVLIVDDHGNFSQAGWEPLASARRADDLLYLSVLLHCVLSYPSGRLDSRGTRLVAELPTS